MFKIWTKIMDKDKIVKDYVFESDDVFKIARLGLYMSEICNELDIETPIILNKHLEHFYLFHTTTFSNRDFITAPNFEKLVIEQIA